jgi:DNA-binding transcriptional regulator YbjK
MIALRQDVIMSQTERDRPSVLRAARERTRAEITREILDAARRHLATDGASGLGLRAIARELGVSPIASGAFSPGPRRPSPPTPC